MRSLGRDSIEKLLDDNPMKEIVHELSELEDELKEAKVDR